MKIRILNQVLCFIFFLLLMYLYAPQGFSQTPAVENPPIDDPALQEKINQAVEKKLDEVLPGYIEQGINRKLPGAMALKLQEIKQREDDQRERWLERNQDLRGRFMVGPVGVDGAYGVKFDLNPGLNASTGAGMSQSNIYYARITPFIRVEGNKDAEGNRQDSFGAELSLDAKHLKEANDQQNATNVQNFLKNEVATTGELRDQITKVNFKDAYMYYSKSIHKDKGVVKVYAGQVPVPFITEVVDQAVFHKSILDKYNLTTSLSARVDIGYGLVEGPNGQIVERQFEIQAATLHLDQNSNAQDFAARILLSLSILNRFSEINFKPMHVWAGFARIGSGTPTAGESALVTNPNQAQEMAVFGFKIDLNKLTGSELGEIFAEFVRRRKTGDITDQSWVVGWNKKLEPSKEGERPIEVGVRFQSQQDDPDVTVADGSVLSAGALIPLVDYSVALRMNLGYIFQSTDPERDGEVIFTTDFEVLW